MSLVIRAERGMMTLSLLILLSTSLFVFLLFDDDILRLHSALVSQRQHYVQQSLALQQLSQQGKDQACTQVPLNRPETVYRVTFQQQGFTDDNQHYIWCERQGLFRKSPVKSLLERQFSQYVHAQHVVLFQAKLNAPKEAQANPRFYWFKADQNNWELAENVQAVIVAEGALHISGKGKISGAVITGGEFSKADSVNLAYSKATVAQVVSQYSQWHRAEKSWYDFNP